MKNRREDQASSSSGGKDGNRQKSGEMEKGEIPRPERCPGIRGVYGFKLHTCPGLNPSTHYIKPGCLEAKLVPKLLLPPDRAHIAPSSSPARDHSSRHPVQRGSQADD
ncbi:unnamed protein product [Pleuronectes platessa]|uniref:Uncharacterized protein n=1 Tax=Pleuronectes platessa TaxID=8262 RepID=A0A9N7UUN8_PLEPL|nr:unnamed protein product [Pleuronectes platessa]